MTLPTSIPNLSHIILARFGFDEPENTLMFGILLFESTVKINEKLTLEKGQTFKRD